MKHFKKTLLALSLAAAFGGSADAALQRMGPINNSPTVGGFPAWFQDTTGLSMEFCDPLNQAELNGGWCTLIPPQPATAPEHFPDNFFIEHFYWDATNITKDAQGLGVKVRFIMAMEASFANGFNVVPGDQMTFGRIRINMNPVPYSGDYVVYHPYGVWNFPGLKAGDRLFVTEDVGLGCVATFECTLGTSIGPFLLPSPVSGGVEVPPIPDLQAGQDPWYDALVALGAATAYPGTAKKYIADPGRIGPVTGSPLPPFLGNDGQLHDHNTLRIEGPNGFVIDAPNNWVLTGRVVTGAIPGKVEVDRASYATSATGNKLDVFARAFESTATRLPAQPLPPPVTPVLSFYDVPCGGAITIDPVTGATVVNPPPYTAPLAPKNPMGVSTNNLWGQNQPLAIPSHVCVEDDTARDALGNIVPVFYLKAATDDVSISNPLATGQVPAAYYDGPGGGNLIVKAFSSDPASVLTLAGFGPGGTGLALAPDATGVLTGTVPALLAPPAKVQVVSSAGGAAELPVMTALGSAVIGGVPVAVNDTVTMNEDCSATPAASCATPQVIDPLANDTVAIGGVATPIRSSGLAFTVAITQTPRLGTAVVNADGTISYTPNANANGADAIGYTVSTGALSNPALVSITITPVADPPLAIGDTSGALRGVLNKVNVFANDVDPDGAANLNAGSAVVVTGNAALGITAGTSFPGGVITYTPPATTAAGPQIFTYNAVDADGLTSATPATVTVNVSTAEAIVPQKAIYTQKTGRWTLAGTDSPAAGQTLTITYNNGVYLVNGVCPNPVPPVGSPGNATGTVVGSAAVDPLSNWLDDHILSNTFSILNPSSTNQTARFWCSPPNSVRITSSLSGTSVTFPISLK